MQENSHPLPTPMECKHGQLARSCGICELERENAELRAVNAVVSNGLRDEIAELRTQLAEAKRQRDEARKDAERYLDAIFQMADDGWLMHGEEGMDDTQEVVYAIAQEHPEYKRRVADAAKEKTNG